MDARVLAATNKDLPDGDPRRPLPRGPVLPPERRADLRAAAARAARGHPAAGRSLHGDARRASTGGAPKTFEADAVAALQRYRWPGNVRELRNLVERLMIMVPGDRVSSRDLTFPRARASSRAPPADAAAGADRAAARRARRVREAVHPARAGGAARQHVAHRGSARRRAQQPVPEDARVRHHAGAREATDDGDRREPAQRTTSPTPALIVDVAALDRNIARMAAFFAGGPCRLRPHFKAHKTPEIARRQLAAGSCVGLTCATVSRGRGRRRAL